MSNVKSAIYVHFIEGRRAEKHFASHYPSEYKAILEQTSYMDEWFPSLKERCAHIYHDLSAYPLCQWCHEEWTSFINVAQGYRAYCCGSCGGKAEKEKARQTVLANHGVACAANSETNKAKRRADNLAKHGVEHYTQSEDFKAKFQRRVAEGIDRKVRSKEDRERLAYLAHESHKANVEEEAKSFIATHGYDAYMQAAIDDRNLVQNSKLRYSFLTSLGPPEYRNLSVLQAIYHYQNGLTQIPTCSECGGSLRFKDRKRGYDRLCCRNSEWLRKRHHVDKLSIMEICSELEVDYQVMLRLLRKWGIEVIQYEFRRSNAEKEIESFLLDLGVRARPNVRDIVTGYELDLVIDSHRVAIEYNGLYWHSTKFRPNASYHKRKAQLCLEAGYRLITIFEDDWMRNSDLVKRKLRNALKVGSNSTVYARSCTIAEVSPASRRAFFQANHLQGNGRGSYCYGLYYRSELVACLLMAKASDSDWLIDRFATSCNVPGGFSRLLKKFIEDANPSEVVTFADVCWSNPYDNVYTKTGFVFERWTAPNYWYVIGGQRYSRQNYQKHKLKAQLDVFDDSLSEVENMSANGFHRIFDCGHGKYRLKLA